MCIRDRHKGDAALYCVDGPVTVNLVELEESFVMEPEDTFFIPAGVSYQLVNFEDVYKRQMISSCIRLMKFHLFRN